MDSLTITKSGEGHPMIDRPWGYACFDGKRVWIPAIFGDMGTALREIWETWRCERMVFSAVLNPMELKKHLRNVVREWDEWFDRAESYSHCIEIRYEAP